MCADMRAPRAVGKLVVETVLNEYRRAYTDAPQNSRASRKDCTLAHDPERDGEALGADHGDGAEQRADGQVQDQVAQPGVRVRARLYIGSSSAIADGMSTAHV